jgi:SAM-dependent methyltransferase
VKIKNLRNITSFSILNKIVNYYGFKLVPKGLDYFDPETQINAAKEKGLSLCEYLESYNVSGVGKRRDAIIESFKMHLPDVAKTILEIGAGTGMYMEKIIENYHPKKIEVYETNLGWVKYLKGEYNSKTNLVCHNADGVSLNYTKDYSVDLVFSNGVFVYLPLIQTFRYLEEMVRVCKPGGYIVFDCFTSKNFGIEIIKKWAESIHSFPVIISDELINEFGICFNLDLRASFNVNYHESYSTYFIFQKNSVHDLKNQI